MLDGGESGAVASDAVAASGTVCVESGSRVVVGSVVVRVAEVEVLGSAGRKAASAVVGGLLVDVFVGKRDSVVGVRIRERGQGGRRRFVEFSELGLLPY